MSKATLLLIEDAPDLAQVVSRELEADGYTVYTAADGVTGLDYQRQYQPDLIILDWMLPKMDGLEVLRRIRQQSATPILMLTSRSSETDRVVGLELGADDYLSKPFSLRELVARVHVLLRRIENVQRIIESDRRPDSQALTYGNLYLNPQTYEASQADQPLKLTRTEFDLLQLLMRNPGITFNRSYLVDTIWGENFVSGDRSVDSAIKRLRKKLGPLGEAIESVWGIGYRLRRSP
jgi:DNA-binding response OmpR family regulator